MGLLSVEASLQYTSQSRRSHFRSRAERGGGVKVACSLGRWPSQDSRWVVRPFPAAIRRKHTHSTLVQRSEISPEEGCCLRRCWSTAVQGSCGACYTLAPSGGDHSSHARRPCRRTLSPTHGGAPTRWSPVRSQICAPSRPSIVPAARKLGFSPGAAAAAAACAPNKWWRARGRAYSQRALPSRPFGLCVCVCVANLLSLAFSLEIIPRGAIAGQLTVLSFLR